jgi:hypothetical protein
MIDAPLAALTGSIGVDQSRLLRAHRVPEGHGRPSDPVARPAPGTPATGHRSARRPGRGRAAAVSMALAPFPAAQPAQPIEKSHSLSGQVRNTGSIIGHPGDSSMKAAIATGWRGPLQDCPFRQVALCANVEACAAY